MARNWFTVASRGLSLLSNGALLAYGFDNTRQDNLAVYWGQDSYGATSSNTAYYQQAINYYCQDDVIDAIPIAFLNVFFGEGGYPSIDLANTCSTADDPVFNGTQMPDCSFLASDIEACQSAGKIVTISLGGATGAIGFSNESQAEEFAQTIWNVFLGGSSDVRPFGAAVLDGIDLDIEGGSTSYFTNFVSTLRGYMNGGSKQYYITAAPQCPFPDAYVGSIIDAEPFDAIYVQFYNNYCELTEYNDTNDWDFSTWDNWAKTTSPNPSVKVYIGAPAASAAAGSGYVDAATLGEIAIQTREQYSSFGGVMLWDASQAYGNDRYDAQVKSSITESGGATTTPTSTPTTSPTSAPTTSPTTTPAPTTSPTTTTPPASTTTASGGTVDCTGVNTWVSNVAYVGGDQVVYGGDLWTAKWWSYADIPGGAAGDWTNDGVCAATNLQAGEYVKVQYQSKEAPLTAQAKATVARFSVPTPVQVWSRFFRF
ncbi:glycoside hydrolase superfamily [Sparassis latifolia]|uniref:chitinase n=1 Tax=Sparassis crispa TaxID=139825 RepID=A0A401H1I9_9APHY|nr:Chitinase 1 [Sparassis crispa]GBE88295.1 Chitinase 1 [Sparassis crispa]